MTPTPDMKPYAERLAKATGIQFREGDGLAWWIESPEQLLCHANMTVAQQWAFWGPLADEFGIKAVWCLDSHDNLLEACAEAVCQEAERRAEEST